MLQIVYISTASPGLGSGEFESLLESARLRNRAEELTSLLIYDGQRFMQAIEGPEARVERCLSRIAGDSRHVGVDIMFARTVLVRGFGTWDLQFHRIDDGMNLSGLAVIDAIARQLADNAMRDFVRKFCGMKRLAA